MKLQIVDTEQEELLLPYFKTAVQAGFPSPALDYVEERIDLNKLLIKHPSATFFIPVEGDSMIGAFIPPKALLLVDRALNAKSGDIVVAVINGEFTVKRLISTHAGKFLSPENAKYKPIKIEEGTDCQIWGVVSNIIVNAREV
jgi:DNA polymerase V